MSHSAGTLRLSPAQMAGNWYVILLSALLIAAALAGCGGDKTPHRVTAPQCVTVGGTHEKVLSLVPPGAGTLRVGIEERAISIAATLDTAAAWAASPVERLGTIVLVAKTEPKRAHTLHIKVEDSPDISGTVCVTMEVIQPARLREKAEQAFSAAGRATHEREWEAAFAEYLHAAIDFDRLRLPRSAASARQAMAEIAYLRFDRKRDSYALAGEALAGLELGGTRALSSTDAAFVGALTGLQGKALLDIPGLGPEVVASRVRSLFDSARTYDRASGFGAREIPRLDIMTGFLEYTLDAPARAREVFAGAARTCRELRDWDCYAIANQNLAEFAAESNNYAAALSEYEDALRVLPPDLDPKLSADIWNNYARVQGIVGLFSSSEHSHATAMRQYARLGDCPGIRRSLSWSGNLMVQIGTLSDAEDNLQQAASSECPELLAANDTAAAAPGAPVESTARASAQNPGARAEPCSQPLDVSTLATDNRVIVFNSLLSLGGAFMLEGEAALAQQCVDAAERYAATARTQMRLANARGAMLLERNDSEHARAEFERSLRIADEAKVPARYEYRGIAQLGLLKSALLAGNPADAVRKGIEVLRSSVDRGDIDQTVTALRLLAAGYRGLQRPQDAARTLQAAADLIEGIPIDQLDGEKRATYLATQYTVFAELTDLYASQAGAAPVSGPKGDVAQAGAAQMSGPKGDVAQAGAAQVSGPKGDVAQAGAARSDALVADVTRGAADAARSDMAWLAFATSERGRARSLRYAINQATRDASPLAAPPEAKYQQLLHDVVELPHSNTGAAGDLTDELDKAAMRVRGTPELFDREQLTRTLRQLDAALVEYVVGSQDMFAIIATVDDAYVVRLGDRRDIASAAEGLHEKLRDTESPPGEVSAAAAKLARLVLWPITGCLRSKHIVFVPDDGLHTVPFNALPWSSNAADHLVLQHAEISVVPSALFLTRIRPTSSARSDSPRIELIGDPVFRTPEWHQKCPEPVVAAAPVPRTGDTSVPRNVADWTESLPDLPGSRAEVQAIARLARQSRAGSRIEMLLGCAAVPGALRRAAVERIDLLHIATHARVDAQRPRLSALALTPEGSGDKASSVFGLLDILALKLHSNLVVLSACETSRGRLLPGEGVLGPAQAFLQAGASTVLASYWRVDDQTTASFMQRFYKYLLLDHLPASTALRRAQLDQAATSPSYEWSAFALYGWPDSGV